MSIKIISIRKTNHKLANKKTKTVNYGGQEITVEINQNCLAIDKNGDLFSFKEEPEKDDIAEAWWSNENDGIFILEAETFEGNWEESLLKI